MLGMQQRALWHYFRGDHFQCCTQKGILIILSWDHFGRLEEVSDTREDNQEIMPKRGAVSAVWWAFSLKEVRCRPHIYLT